MFCMQCGKELPESAKFCVGCGTPTQTHSRQKTIEANVIETDENKEAKYAWGANNRDMQGLYPVRMKHIAPTDRKTIESAVIDVVSGPMIHHRVIKSQTAKGAYSVPIVFSLLAATLSAGGFAVKEPGLAWGSMAAAVFLFFLGIMMASNRRKNFRLGFDWKTNTIWALLEGRKPSYLGNASCITALSVNKSTTVSSRYANIGSSSNRIYTRVNDKKNVWHLMVAKSDGSNIPLFAFYSANDASKVLQQSLALLSLQK